MPNHLSLPNLSWTRWRGGGRDCSELFRNSLTNIFSDTTSRQSLSEKFIYLRFGPRVYATNSISRLYYRFFYYYNYHYYQYHLKFLGKRIENERVSLSPLSNIMVLLRVRVFWRHISHRFINSSEKKLAD